MAFRLPIFLLFLLINSFAYIALRRSVVRWTDANRRRRGLWLLNLAVLMINLPLVVFFIRGFNARLLQFPTEVLEVIFYPSTAWLVTIIAFFLIGAPVAVLWWLGRGVGRLFQGKNRPPDYMGATEEVDLSRRGFLAGSAGLLVPAIYGVAAYGTYGSIGDLEISQEQLIPIRNLPRSMDGMRVLQISDIHVGPYVREKELRAVVGQINAQQPDVVVITGDILDWELSSLPDAVNGLRGIRSTLGNFAVLGNHDLYADQYSYTSEHRGGVEIVKGMESIGIRTLRNEVIDIGEGPDQVALMGLDWLVPDPSSPNFYRYQQAETLRVLGRMAEPIAPERPKLLLAHHPNTFEAARSFGIDLTLSGHTHGGGQVLAGHWNGIPLGIAMVRYKYLSGLYQDHGSLLYVNRGIGYLGIPIRINCPPEISIFKLTTARNG